MTEQEQIAANQYRFSGYQLNLIILDETGPSYAVEEPHPYYYNQPAYWQKNSFAADCFYYAEVIGGNIPKDTNPLSSQPPSTIAGQPTYRPNTFRMLSF